jgi:ABC-2 type transport system ATP-binding protein
VTAVVRARGVRKAWGATPVLEGVDLDVAGGVTGLLGSNGTGKTTLLGLLLGLHRPDAGTIEVLGVDPARAGHEVRAQVGYAPEHDVLAPETKAVDLVRHLTEVHGLPRREATARASDALWQVGLGEERLRPVGTMSTGQKQRVKIAAAVAHDPALVLLDEPTNGLDPVQRDEVLALISRIGGEFGVHVLLSSHLLEEVERVCDSVVILGGGRVIASGPLRDLRGSDSGLVVDLDLPPGGSAAPVAEALAARGLTVTVEGARLAVAQGGDEALDAVRDVLADSGVGVRRLSARTATLSDVFLAAGSS